MICAQPSSGDAAPVLDAMVRAFLEAMAQSGTAPLEAPNLEAGRAALAALQRLPVDAPAAVVEDLVLPVGPTGAVGLRLLRPSVRNGRPLPFILYLHGGAWVMGGPATHDRLMRELAAGAEAVVACLDYALAPDATHPVQVEQAHAALCHLVAQAATYGLDASRIAVAGDCAGGAMAAAVALLAKRRRGPEIAFQLLLTPILAVPDAAPDAAAPWFSPAALGRCIAAEFPDPASRRLPTAFPLQATLEELNDLPPALVIVAEADPLRDQGEAYVRRLVEAGVEATAARHSGTIHDFAVLNALAGTPAARGAVAQATAALRRALYGP